jgi:hypothetical protein
MGSVSAGDRRTDRWMFGFLLRAVWNEESERGGKEIKNEMIGGNCSSGTVMSLSN